MKYSKLQKDSLERFLIKYNKIRCLDGCITFNVSKNDILIDDAFFYKGDDLVTIEDRMIKDAKELVSELLMHYSENDENYRIKAAVFVFASGYLSIAWL